LPMDTCVRKGGGSAWKKRKEDGGGKGTEYRPGQGEKGDKGKGTSSKCGEKKFVEQGDNGWNNCIKESTAN